MGSGWVPGKQGSRKTGRWGPLGAGAGLGLAWGSDHQTSKGLSLVLPSWSHCSVDANLTPALLPEGGDLRMDWYPKLRAGVGAM